MPPTELAFTIGEASGARIRSDNGSAAFMAQWIPVEVEMRVIARFPIWAALVCAVGCSGNSIPSGSSGRGGTGAHAGSSGKSGVGGTAGSSTSGAGGSAALSGASGVSGTSGAGGEEPCPGDAESGCPPLVDAGADRTVSCTVPEGATVELSGSALDRGGIEAVAWTRAGETLGASLSLTVTAPLGDSEFVLTARDITGDIASDSVVVTVADTDPPALAAPDTDLVLCQCVSFTPPEPEMIDCRPDAATAADPIAIGTSRDWPPFDVPEEFPLEQCPGGELLVRWTLSDGENTTEVEQYMLMREPRTPEERAACD